MSLLRQFDEEIQEKSRAGKTTDQFLEAYMNL